MKKHIWKRMTATEAKLLFSILALLLVLTGCNVPTPTPPAEPEATGTEQPTEEPTELPTEQPTEEVTTAPEPVEARYDIFHALLEKSYTEKQEFEGEIYVEALFNSGYFLDVTIENGQIYLREDLYECTYVENFAIEYPSSLLMFANKSMMAVLDRMQNQTGYYVLQDESNVRYDDKIVVVELDNALYFLTIYTEIGEVIARIHVIYFE